MGQGRNLQNGCFVVDQSDLVLAPHGCISWTQVIGQDDQARALSVFYVEADPGTGPTISTGQSEAVLYLQSGQCDISICGRELNTQAGDGVHVRKGEYFCFNNLTDDTARWLISICPRVEGLNIIADDGTGIDDEFQQRVVSAGDRQLHATGERFYKLLVGPAIGSEAVTQFIGRIPPSKAAEHFHLYEEAICILSGHGLMWTGEQSAAVKPGSMIFLPRKQPHCLECLDADGMELMGVFYPAGSPAINYRT